MKSVFVWVMLLFVNAGAQNTDIGRICVNAAAWSSQFSNAISSNYNPAALGNVKKFQAALFNEKPFLVDDWNQLSAGLVLPVQAGAFGLALSYSANQFYSAKTICISYGKDLGENTSVGIGLNYRNHSVKEYGSTGSPGYKLALEFRVTPEFHTGIILSNDAGDVIEETQREKFLPRNFNAGFSYELSRLVFISAEIEKRASTPPHFKAGLHYAFDEKLFARAGFSSLNQVFYFGGGVKLKKFALLAVGAVHPQLGPTPGLMLFYEKEKLIK